MQSRSGSGSETQFLEGALLGVRRRQGGWGQRSMPGDRADPSRRVPSQAVMLAIGLALLAFQLLVLAVFVLAWIRNVPLDRLLSSG